ncbi:nuclease-related domain-containing protein [Nocardioides sp. YIM 152588]|uniref:nuclease-related domain-containing protein n=1 Tax=Nocardioides sp. YIM 152588 TaxID=3158259 RepID=UPI0032E43495
MSEGAVADEKRMKLRYAGACRLCGADLPARAEAIYERATKTVRCVDCSPTGAVAEVRAQQTSKSPEPDEPLTRVVEPVETPEPIDAGTPGASARREFERRQAKREDRIREKHPKLGGLILALSDDPQSTTAWKTGAIGEERLGEKLNALASDSVRVLHDRRIPGSRANIDHIAVTPSGIYVIDAKRYRGRPSLKVEGGLLRPRTEKLLVGTRDCTKVVEGVLKQVDVVRGIVGEQVPVTGVLCFIEADWPLIGGAFTTRGVEVIWPKKLYPRLMGPGPLESEIADLYAAIAAALPRS